MADNTIIPPGAGGDTIRTMDRGTSKTQVVALDYGPDAGPESLVSVSNGLPVAQQGTWTVAGSGTFTVAGAVTVSNFPATQPVSGTFWQATQPVSGTVAATQSGAWTTGRTWTLASGTDSVAAVQFGAWSVAQSGAWTVGVSGTVTVAGAVSVSNFPATQPVSGTVTVSNLPGPGPAPSSGSLSVVIAPDQVVPVQFNPDGLGPAGMDTSLPVTLALDQPPIPVQAVPTGQLPMQQSVSVT